MANINPNHESSKSQEKMILEYMQNGGKLTQMDALVLFRCFRLASRISDLRKKGYSIACEWVYIKTSKKKVKRYSIS